MSQDTAVYMREFFNNRDSHTSPEETAKEFGKYFNKKRISQLVSKGQNETFNVSALGRKTPLSFMTKRLLLISDTIALMQYGEKSHIIDSWEYPQVYPEDQLEYRVYLKCADIFELGQWLNDCQELLVNGDVFFYPEITQNAHYYVEMGGHSGVRESPPLNLVDAIIDKRQISDVLTDDPVKSHLIRPIAKLSIPYIDDADLRLFSKITVDERVAYKKFRDYVRQQLLELQCIEGDEAFEEKLEMLAIKLRSDSNKLSNDFRKISKKRAFQLSGATIATTTAILVAVNSAAFGVLPQFIGAGGGGYMFLKAIEEYVLNASDLKNSPYYYLWLLNDGN